MIWRRRPRVPSIRQAQATECGLAALAMLMGYHGCAVPLAELRQRAGPSINGTPLALLKRLAGDYGFVARAFRKEPETLSALGFPCMVFVNFNHLLVVEAMDDGGVQVNDPDGGRRCLSLTEFDHAFTGVALVLEPGPAIQTRPPRRFDVLPALLRSCSGWWVGGVVLALLCGGAEILLAGALEQGGIAAALTLAGLALLAGQGLLTAAGRSVRRRAAVFVGDCLFSRSGDFFGYRSLESMSYLLHLPTTLGQWVGSGPGALFFAVVSGLVVLVGLAVVAPLVALAVLMAWLICALALARAYLPIAAAWRRLPPHGAGGSPFGPFWQSACRDEDALAEQAAAHLRTRLAGRRFALDDAVLWAVMALSVGAAFGVSLLLSPGLTVPVLVLLACRWWLDAPAALPALLAVPQMAAALDDLALSPVQGPAPADAGDGLVARLDHVGFSHGALPVLEDFSLTIEPGAVIGVGGASGAGKTTLARLVSGQVRAAAGSVRLRGRVALVPSLPVLFAASIADNVACWRPGIDAKRVAWALRIAGLWDDIAARAGGMTALIDVENGNFSGGQQRRLMLARALAGGPDLLVLDETLDAVDTATATAILANLRAAGLTVLLVSQRRHTLARCDRVVWLAGSDTDDPGEEVRHGAVWQAEPSPPPLHWPALVVAAKEMGLALPPDPASVPCPPHQHPLHWQARLHGLLLLPVILDRLHRPGVLLADDGQAVLVPARLGGYRLWRPGQGWRRLGTAQAARLVPTAWAVIRRRRGTLQAAAHAAALSPRWLRERAEDKVRHWVETARNWRRDGMTSALGALVSGLAVAVLATQSVALLALAAGVALVALVLAWGRDACTDCARGPERAAEMFLRQILLLMPSVLATPLAQALRWRWAGLERRATVLADRRDLWAAAARLWVLLAPLLALAVLPMIPAIAAAWAGLGLGRGLAGVLRAGLSFRRLRPFRHAPREDGGERPVQPPQAVAADNLCFAYDQPVLQQVSLSVATGEIVAIAGPSGCGKSTLLRLLQGSERPQAGRVYWDGRDLALADRLTWRAHADAIDQDQPLDLSLLHALVRGRAWVGLDRVVAQLTAVGLWPKVASMPLGLASLVDGRMFSSGEAAQLMLARALVRQPRILFLDETLSTLDPALQRHLLGLIRAGGITCILTSHQDEVLALADRVIWLDQGRIDREKQNETSRLVVPPVETQALPPAPFGQAARLYRPTVLDRIAAPQSWDVLAG